MNTIKIYLAESGRIADLKKDFPLYQGQFQNKLLNVFVPTSIVAPSYTSQNADGVTLADYVASTSVKIGMSYTARNGTIKVSKNYYMRFLKTLTYQNVEYALYERKLPKEFTLYSGQGANAPILTANVVNIQQETENGEPIILSVITSQTCSLDVMPSTSLDNDEAVEPTELENINAQLNEINEILPTKQDKIDNSLETTNKSVVGAINENKGRIDINTQDIETNRQNIAGNRNDIDFILENYAATEEYIGQLTGTSLPSDSELTSFVQQNTSPSRLPKNADVVIFILQVASGTDKNYKYVYSATGWNGYEIPPLETASNGTLGIVEGTYTTTNNDTVVDISGGKILNIYIKDNLGAYRNVREFLNTTKTTIDSIINGETSVGKALRSVADELGNNIVDTYLTKTLGATKQYVRDYAMPREFNDVYFITTTGYSQQVPTTPESGIQFTTTTNAVADFQLFQIQKTNTADFELSSKNGYSNNIYVSASVNCRVAFRLTTQYKKLGQDWADLNVELTSPINLVAGDIEKVMFGNPFTSLEENVISLTDGDLIRQTLEVVSQTSETITFNVYSNDIYPSTFNLTSQSYVLSDVEQSVSRLILLGMDGVVEANRVVFEVQNPDSFVEYRTNQREFLVNGHLPIVGELDDTLPVYITFGETTYGVFSYMKGSSTPITIGDLKSNIIYSAETGYSFTSKMIFLETSDYQGFVISPATITAQQLSNIINDSETIVVSLDSSGTKLELQLSANTLNRLMKALITPMSAPSGIEIVAIDDGNSQIMLELGEGLYVADGQLKVTGAGESGGTTNYQDLDNKPILNSNNTTSQTPNASETINGTINLHKVSKTGALADTIQDSTHRTVTDTEKQTWDNKVSKATNVSVGEAGGAFVYAFSRNSQGVPTDQTIRIGSTPTIYNIPRYSENLTLKSNTPVANNDCVPKGYLDPIIASLEGQNEYIGSYDGDTYTAQTIQSVLSAFVQSTEGRVPRAGDIVNIVNGIYGGQQWIYSGDSATWKYYIDFENHSVINNLTSTSTTDGLSAMQGKVLNDMINTLSQELADTQSDVADNMTDIGGLQGRTSTLEGKTSTLEGKVSTLESDNTTNKSKISQLETKTNTLETSKQDKLTIDTTPTQNSTNPIQSGAMFDNLSLRAKRIADITLSSSSSEVLIDVGKREGKYRIYIWTEYVSEAENWTISLVNSGGVGDSIGIVGTFGGYHGYCIADLFLLDGKGGGLTSSACGYDSQATRKSVTNCYLFNIGLGTTLTLKGSRNIPRGTRIIVYKYDEV